VLRNNNKNSIYDINASPSLREKSTNSNLNNSEFNLNNTNIEDDLMAKINKEAQKFESNTISGEDIYDKFEKVTEQQFKEMTKEKKYLQI
jgi:formiminotetrahydrofolate cyclodeaminase